MLQTVDTNARAKMYAANTKLQCTNHRHIVAIYTVRRLDMSHVLSSHTTLCLLCLRALNYSVVMFRYHFVISIRHP